MRAVPERIENADRIVDAYRDFAIVCKQRSGSHLLATALDSHPDVCCQGELLQSVSRPGKAYAPQPRLPYGVRGAILMYSQWKMAAELGIRPARFIHLLRNPTETAISISRNKANSRLRGSEHRPHEIRGAERKQVTDFDTSDVPRLARDIAEEQQMFSSLLGSHALLEIRYEVLTDDKDAKVLPPDASSDLLGFLGVSRTDFVLTPLTQKTS